MLQIRSRCQWDYIAGVISHPPAAPPPPVHVVRPCRLGGGLRKVSLFETAAGRSAGRAASVNDVTPSAMAKSARSRPCMEIYGACLKHKSRTNLSVEQ